MKTLTPSYRPRPKPADLETPVAVLFTLTLFFVGLYLVAQRPSIAPQPVAGPRLGLALSGVLTSQFSLSRSDFAAVRCTASGFFVKSVTTLAPTGLELRFRGPDSGGRNATYLLGAGVGPLTLRAGGAFTSHSGSVTRSEGGFTFSAAAVDPYGQPLLVSGRLVCPQGPL